MGNKLRKTTHDDDNSALLKRFMLKRSGKNKTNKSGRNIFNIKECFIIYRCKLIPVQ